MKQNILLFAIVLGCITFSCKKKKDEEPTPTQNVPTTGIDKNKLLQLVNNLRTNGCTCGSTNMPKVAAVVWNDLLEQAATAHSQDMATKNYFSHTSQDGRTPSQRLTAVGYAWKTYGENIASGYTTEESVINGWKNSEGHCKNIMNASMTEMGIGRSENYWTQILSTR
jgi:uncharacterized protein YkwD